MRGYGEILSKCAEARIRNCSATLKWYTVGCMLYNANALKSAIEWWLYIGLIDSRREVHVGGIDARKTRLHQDMSGFQIADVDSSWND